MAACWSEGRIWSSNWRVAGSNLRMGHGLGCPEQSTKSPLLPTAPAPYSKWSNNPAAEISALAMGHASSNTEPPFFRKHYHMCDCRVCWKVTEGQVQ